METIFETKTSLGILQGFNATDNRQSMIKRKRRKNKTKQNFRILWYQTIGMWYLLVETSDQHKNEARPRLATGHPLTRSQRMVEQPAWLAAKTTKAKN